LEISGTTASSFPRLYKFHSHSTNSIPEPYLGCYWNICTPDLCNWTSWGTRTPESCCLRWCHAWVQTEGKKCRKQWWEELRRNWVETKLRRAQNVAVTVAAAFAVARNSSHRN
jgi:hypothetical protein